jgi:hypothetical protein
MAATFALITALTGAALLSDLMPNTTPARTTVTRPGPPFAARAFATATAGGLAVAALFGILASADLAQPVSPFLRWTLLPVIGLVVAGLAAAAHAALTPADNVNRHSLTTFPVASTITGALGMALLQIYISTPVAPGWQLAITLTGRAGAVLIAIGASIALANTNLWRALIAAPLIIFAAAIVGVSATGYLAVIYSIAASIWWLKRVAILIAHSYQAAREQPAHTNLPGPRRDGTAQGEAGSAQT